VEGSENTLELLVCESVSVVLVGEKEENVKVRLSGGAEAVERL
jgi:hypothetical protein